MRLILGTAQFDGSYGRFRNQNSVQPIQTLLDSAWSAGYTCIDTAAAYKGVEDLIGRSKWRGKIHTKFDSRISPEESIKESARRLGRTGLEVAYFHNPDVVWEEETVTNKIRKSVSRELAERIGVSVYSPEEALRALEHPEIEVIQIPLNVADGRWDEGLLGTIRDREKTLYARSVFLQGALLAKPSNLPEFLSPLKPLLVELNEISLSYGISVAEALLSWVRLKTGISGLMIGAESRAQITLNSAAFFSNSLPAEAAKVLERFATRIEDLVDPRRWPNT